MPPVKRPYYYFQPNQLGMRVSHKGDTPNPDAITQSWNFINQQATDRFHLGADVVAFPPQPDVVRQYQFTLQTEQGAVTKTFAFRDTKVLAPQDLPKLVKHINDSNDKRNKEAPELEMVDLNWLACGGGNGNWGGDGGPGGPPEPFPPIGQSMPAPIPYKFRDRVPGGIIELLGPDESRGKGITVAILDTAPRDEDLDCAYAKWVTYAAPGKEHPLLKALWGEDENTRRLKIEHMTDPTRDRLKSYSLQKHPYSISDHGLFIAGIIHSIAPQAELHLYEALNDHGVCDSESVLAGLDWVTNTLKPERIVINCSLFLLIPYDEEQFSDDVKDWFDPLFPGNLQKVRDWMKTQGYFSEPTFTSLTTENSYVIAAAGNDWEREKGRRRPLTRFPAAFTSVQGVGAMEDVPSRRTAAYSNIDDDPQKDGILAFGGGIATPQNKDAQGILGLYINCCFPATETAPKVRPNNTGWARWAGTSFATPIVSGLVAAMMSGPYPPFSVSAKDDVAMLKSTYTIPTGPAGKQENVLDVIQD